MITPFDFQGMSLDERAEAVWKGTYIDERTDKQHKILLYRLESFYAEVFYDAASNQITTIECFTSNDQLKPYLVKHKTGFPK